LAAAGRFAAFADALAPTVESLEVAAPAGLGAAGRFAALADARLGAAGRFVALADALLKTVEALAAAAADLVVSASEALLAAAVEALALTEGLALAAVGAKVCILLSVFNFSSLLIHPLSATLPHRLALDMFLPKTVLGQKDKIS
jgi:hypothetical protein